MLPTSRPHHVTVTNRFGNTITAPVVYVKDLGEGRAEVHIETNYPIEMDYNYPAVYTVRDKQGCGNDS
jgi:hypothetical protein